jgi:hypothetical protein
MRRGLGRRWVEANVVEHLLTRSSATLLNNYVCMVAGTKVWIAEAKRELQLFAICLID